MKKQLLAATGALLAVSVAAPAQAYTSQSSALGAGYLAAQLAANGDHLSVVYSGTSYDDYGLTADAILASDSAKAGQAEAKKATAYLAAHVNDYIDSYGSKSAGATAKTLVVAAAQRALTNRNTTFGGVNLVQRLGSLMKANGRYSDVSSYGDYSNMFSQSLAIIGLRKAGKYVPGKAIGFLRIQQCPNGGFTQTLGNRRCTVNSNAETDATAMATQALVALPSSRWRNAAIRAAGTYLARHQQPNGAFGGGSSTQGANSNSTGLALIGLKAAGRNGAATKASNYLRSLQYGCAYAASFRGAVAYDAASKAAGKTASAPSDQDTRATAQAVLGLAGVPYVRISNVNAAAGAPSYAC